jgi:flagellar biosynthesis GTPase FlhF
VTYGVDGVSWADFGSGVRGRATATTGTNYGVLGQSASIDGRGVFGKATSNAGWTYGVYGQSLSTTFGYGVYSSGDFGASGSKSCIVKTSKGPTRLYCQESPEVWFEDFGESQLVDGHARVELDRLFLETIVVNGDNPLKVFVQLRDDCNGTYVRTGASGFNVVELNGGTSNARFAYRVVAKRAGFEDERLEVDEAARTDSYLYPDLQEREREELEMDRAQLEEQHRRIQQESSELQEQLAAMARAEHEREAVWKMRAKDSAEMIEECARMERDRVQIMSEAVDTGD